MSQEEQPHKTPKNVILNEFVSKQLIDIPVDKRLNFSDLKRISKYLDTSIFNEKQCSLWTGYITNNNNDVKGTYINFYFRNKKVALHRLLYNNFVEILSDDEYLKYSCDNKGKCCCIHHLKKFKYHKKQLQNPKDSKVNKDIDDKILNDQSENIDNLLHIDFE